MARSAMNRGTAAEPAYKRLTPEELWRAHRRSAPPPHLESLLTYYDASCFAARCGADQLEHRVKVIDFPAAGQCAPDVQEQAERELLALRREGLMQAMRGGRPTDLLRPLPSPIAARLQACPALVSLIENLETGLAGSGLFLRSIKLDDARASSTSKLSDRRSTHLHFDAERASRSSFGGSIRQFYVNLSPTPRHFLIVSATLEQMITRLDDEARDEPVGEILGRFIERFGLAAESCSVPPWTLVIFDGRAFAHDAGKFTETSYARGEGPLELAHRPDLVAALDLLETNYEHTGYAPSRPFLEDLAT